MAHRRVGYQLFDVFLSEGDCRSVEDADHCQDGNPGRQLYRGLREKGEVVAQQAVGAQLEQNTRQDDRARRGRFHVGVGQPGMQGPQGNFDRKGCAESQEQPDLGIERDAAFGNQFRHRECPLVDHQPQDRQQHQYRASHGVQEKLDGSVDAPRPAPNTDQEIHRHQGKLPKDVEQEQVLGEENARHADFEQQEEDHELAHPIFDGRPG